MDDIIKDALQECQKAMNDFLNGEHYDPKTGKTATYFSIPLDKTEKALKLIDSRPAKAVQGDKAEALDAFRNGWVFYGPQENYGPLTAHRIESALTPESEGIAGKGDQTEALKQAIATIRAHWEQNPQTWVTHKIHSKCQEWERTLTRPQEIDVEAIKSEIVPWVSTTLKKGAYHRLEVAGAIDGFIDHLAASGYLSVPVKKGE